VLGKIFQFVEGLPELWQQNLGDPAIKIAVLDGPCDTNHSSLVQATITAMDFVGSGTAGGPAGEHGTHTASIIFGQHDSQIKGVVPLCQGLIIPIFRNTPKGDISSCSQLDLARAMRGPRIWGRT
jgi:subtilisin family serine protease